MKPFTTFAAIFLAVIALVHLYRLVRPFEVVIHGTALPQWVSAVGMVVAGGLSIMVWREIPALARLVRQAVAIG